MTTGTALSYHGSSSTQWWSSINPSRFPPSILYADMCAALGAFLRRTPSFSNLLFPPLSIKGVSFVQVLAALILSLLLPQLAHCLASARLLRGFITSVWIRWSVRSLGLAVRSSERQKGQKIWLRYVTCRLGPYNTCIQPWVQTQNNKNQESNISSRKPNYKNTIK